MGRRLTKKRITQELIKCGNDPIYFINNYVKIAHRQRGRIFFKTFDFQDDLLEMFVEDKDVIILKARQLGISTLTAAYSLWYMIFHKDKAIMTIATKLEVARNLLSKTREMYDDLPDFIKKFSPVDPKVDNKTNFKLANRSWIKASATAKDAGRSEALSLLVIDEAAFIDGLEDLWKGIEGTLSTGGRCIALSTPNGSGGWFYDRYIESLSNLNHFTPVKLPWYVHPERSQEWYEERKKRMSVRDLAQEHECSFNASGMTLIDPEDLERIETKEVCKPKYILGIDRNLWLWENYNPHCTYLITADVARGDGEDSSAFHIINSTTLEQVGEYRGVLEYDDFANFLNKVGRDFGECMIVIENNGLGITVCKELMKLGYVNVYHHKKGTHEYVEPYIVEGRKDVVAGFAMSERTRPLVIAQMKDFIRHKKIKIQSERTLYELKTFIWNGKRAEAQRSRHDDLVMSLAVGCWVRETAILMNYDTSAYANAMINSISVKRNPVTERSYDNIAGINPHTYNIVFGKNGSGTDPKADQKNLSRKYAWLLK